MFLSAPQTAFISQVYSITSVSVCQCRPKICLKTYLKQTRANYILHYHACTSTQYIFSVFLLLPPLVESVVPISSLLVHLQEIMPSIRLFHTGRHWLGWVCAVETFHSRATTPEASLHLQGCHLCRVPGCYSYKRRASCQDRTFHCFPVNSKICWSGQSDDSGIVALLWNVSANPAQLSLVLELQWRPVWKRQISMRMQSKVSWQQNKSSCGVSWATGEWRQGKYFFRRGCWRKDMYMTAAGG